MAGVRNNARSLRISRFCAKMLHIERVSFFFRIGWLIAVVVVQKILSSYLGGSRGGKMLKMDHGETGRQTGGDRSSGVTGDAKRRTQMDEKRCAEA